MKHLISFLLIISLNAGLCAFADVDSSGQSKEDKRFEAQVNLEIPEIVIPPMFEDGRIRVEFAHSGSFFDKTQENKTFIDLSIETRMFAFGGEKCKWDYKAEKTVCNSDNIDPLIFFPIEMRIRTDLAPDDISNTISVKEFRAGIFRILEERYGATLQVASYVFRELDFDYGRVHAIEALSLTLNNAIDLSGDEKVELIIKGRVSFEFAQTYMNREKLDETLTANGYSTNDSTPGFDAYFVAQASVGLRFSKQFIIDVFGGIDEFNYFSVEESLSSNDDSIIGTTFLNHKYLGVGARYIISDDIHLVGTYKRDYYMYRTAFNSSSDDVPSGFKTSKEKNIIDSGFIGLEYRW